MNMRGFLAKLTILVLAGATAGRARADGLDDQAMRDLSSDERLPLLMRQALASEVAAAQQEGVPATLLVDRVEEGLAKGAAPSEIEQLVRRQHATFAQAARLLKTAAPGVLNGADGRSALEATGEALASGVQAEKLGTFLGHPSQLRQGQSPLATEVRARAEAAANLAEHGFPTEGAVALLFSAVDRGHERQALRAVTGAAERLDREGRGPREPLLGRLHEEILRGRSPADLYNTVAAQLPQARTEKRALRHGEQRGPDRDEAYAHAPGK